MLKKCFALFILSTILIGCIGYYKIPKNENGERILNDKVQYKFKSIPSKEDLIKIDTSAYYVQIFEGRYYNEQEKKNPMILIFHNDGYFKNTSVLYHSEFNKRPKNSIYYGGKFKLTDNLIELEKFYPSRGGSTNYYSRNIRRGKIEDDRIIFDDGFSLLTIYEKKYVLK
ncbi:MAG: hypothetical protein ACK5MD_08055 [Flavobacteriales bacterium]